MINLIASGAREGGLLLLHRLAELHARIASGQLPVGATPGDRIVYGSTYWTSGFWPGALWQAATIGGRDDPNRSPEGDTITDSMMNIAILPWARAVTHDPAYARLVAHHARAVARLLVRPDGSTADAAYAFQLGSIARTASTRVRPPAKRTRRPSR